MFLDRHERIQYNSLPGTITPTSWAHQYLQQANEINALYGLKDHVWQTDGGDSTGFGVEPNFGCCTANMQVGGGPRRRGARAHVPQTPLADHHPAATAAAAASVCSKGGRRW